MGYIKETDLFDPFAFAPKKKMSKTELVIQITKIALGIYFVVISYFIYGALKESPDPLDISRDGLVDYQTTGSTQR